MGSDLTFIKTKDNAPLLHIRPGYIRHGFARPEIKSILKNIMHILIWILALIGELDSKSDVILSVPRYRTGNMHIGVINVTYVYTDSYRFHDSLYITQTLSFRLEKGIGSVRPATTHSPWVH
jgi:hypothetical protein